MSLAWLAIAWLCLSRALDRQSLLWGALAGAAAGLMVLGRDQVALLASICWCPCHRLVGRFAATSA